MNTSLSFEILLYLNSFYFVMFGICETSMSLMKFVKFPYPTNAIFSEVSLLIFFCGLETVRIHLGRKGNLSERALPVVVSIALIVPAAVAVLYFLLWQAYVLRLELILCGIQLVLHATELVMAFMCLLPNSKPTVY